MIKNKYYFISCFILSLIVSYFISYKYINFIFYYIFYTFVLFIIIVSITIFPFVYYNHLSEKFFIKKLKKYSINDINDINGLNNNFNAIVKNNNYNVIKKIIENKNIESKIVINDNNIYFYQIFENYILSDIPFITIKIDNIMEITQKNIKINLNIYEKIDFKCNFFIINTFNSKYKLLIQNGKVDNFIDVLYNNYRKLKF